MKIHPYAYVLFIAAIMLILLPFLMRTLNDNTTLPGEEAYYHARIAKQITETGFPMQDDAVSYGRPYYFNPYHAVLAVFSYILGVLNASRIVPLIAGILSVWIFYSLLAKFKLDRLAILSILGVFILSPLFSYSFSLSTPACLMILFNLLGVYFFMKDKKWCFVLSAVFFSATALFGILHALVPAAIVSFYVMYNRKKLNHAYIILALLCIIIFAYDLPVYLQGESIDFVQKSHVTGFISDLGGIGGFSAFTLLLALLGIIGLWSYKKEHYLLYAASIFIVVYSFFDSAAMVYSNFILAFLAGVAFSGLARMKWHLIQVRNFSMIVLFCGLLFSTISHAVALSSLQPDNDTQDALLWIAHRSEAGDKVFSHYSKGFWIEFWAERPVLMDGLLKQTSNAEILYEDSNAIFNSNDLTLTRELLSKYRIKYLFMTRDMAEGLVWNKQGQGLDFLLTNSETFKKRYDNPCCEIYEYILKDL